MIGFKEPFLLFLLDADTAVLDLGLHEYAVILILKVHRETHAALIGILDGIIQNVQQYLLYPALISRNP